MNVILRERKLAQECRISGQSLPFAGPESPQVFSVANNTLSVVISGLPPDGGFDRFELAYRDADNVRTLVDEIATLEDYEITGLDPSSTYLVELATIVGTGENRPISLPDQTTVQTGMKVSSK